MQKLICIDLDGTLLTTNNTITDFTKQTLSEATKYNNHIVIATGRSYHGAKDYYNHLKLKTPLISFNGALISFPDGTHTSKTFKKGLLQDLYDNLGKYFDSAFFNTKDQIFSINHNKELEKLFNGNTIDNITTFNSKHLNNKDILNVIILIKEEHKDTFESYFTNLPIGARYWGSHEGQRFYDVYLNNVSKASAIKEVLRYYNLNKDDLITFGDGPNDLEMINSTKNGIAMLNAKDDIKEAASYLTDYDNDNDGVAKYLIKYYL